MPDEITVKPLVDILSLQLGESVVMSGDGYVYHAGLLPVEQSLVEVALLEQTREFQVREQEAVNKKSEDYLSETDWYVVRFAETGIAIPADIEALRAEARVLVI